VTSLKNGQLTITGRLHGFRRELANAAFPLMNQLFNYWRLRI
jgi:hypothetical protein